MTITGKRPDTVSKALRELADWLDEADRLIDALAEAKGIGRTNSGDDVQRDMRLLASWFRDRPGYDAQAMTYIRRFDTPAAPPAEPPEESETCT